jgi:hypothetical protein
MEKITIIQFRRSRLPLRRLNDGWWLKAPPVRPSVIAFPKRAAPKSNVRGKPWARHLTLVTSGK